MRRRFACTSARITAGLSMVYGFAEQSGGAWPRRRRAGLKVLYMSGYGEDAIPRANHFIQKPFLKQDLARKTREALDG